jgi:adenylate kinase
VQENVQCEIMHVIVEEAREAYAGEIVHAVASNTAEEMERNVDNAHKWAAAWKPAA